MNNQENQKITRAGVTFPPDLLEDFDNITQKMGYDSRSKAIQDVIRLFVTERSWIQKDDGTLHTGVILMVYEHDTRGLEAELTESQHHHKNLITSTMHIHVNEKDCLEVIAIKGKVSEVKHLSDELTTRRGVKLVKTVMATI
jgi:CopG family transcriptional regulator, nickel-responsive regulator